MSRGHKFHNQDGAYFVSFAVVEWMDVFTRNEYKDIVLDSLRFSQRERGMEIYAWVIMTNHVHLLFRCTGDFEPQEVLGRFKQFTSRKIVEAIKAHPKESRKDWMLPQFAKAAAESSNVSNAQFWRHDNMPVELWSNRAIYRKIKYIHQNPVEAGMVARAEDYMYSSARDYADEDGLLEGVVVVRTFR